MLRWSVSQRCLVENLLVDRFIEDVIAVCRKHNKSISHEDSHGAFEIVQLSGDMLEWLSEAADATEGTE